jgi:hypothetical protein
MHPFTQADELRVSKMISTRPLQELDLGHNARLRPNAFLHLLGRQSLSPSPGLLLR